MSAELDRSTVGTLVQAFATANSLTIAWPNRDFQPPQKANWLRVTLRGVDGRQKEMGSTRNIHSYSHVLIVQVFVPANTGDLIARQLADGLADVFRGQAVSVTDGTVRFRAPTVTDVGNSGAWYQMNVSVPVVSDYYQ